MGSVAPPEDNLQDVAPKVGRLQRPSAVIASPTSDTLLIIVVGGAAAAVAAHQPTFAVPIGVGAALVGLLAKIARTKRR